MVVVTMKGQIEEYISTTNSKTTTKDLQEIFSLLDEPVSSKQPRITLVESSLSVGKCFLVKHLSYLWAKGKLLMKNDVLFLVYLQDPAVHNMNSLHDLVHHFYGYDNMLVRLLLLILLNSYKMEENLMQYCWMGIMNIQMIYDNTVLLLTLEDNILQACSIVQVSSHLCSRQRYNQITNVH